jgi:hypothetical protein
MSHIIHAQITSKRHGVNIKKKKRDLDLDT